ncbi:MAG TPA: endonuclease/exonuclease/phosphatase family protein, partial [Gammaproteobacteria bacterium]
MLEQPPRIRVLTYNIHKGFSAGNRRFVLHQIKSLIRSVDSELVFLQEIQGEHLHKSQHHHNWPDESQFEFLADEVWHHHAYGKNAIYEAGHHGNAILSKYPFVEWENIDVSYMRKASRSLLHGVIRISDSMPRLHVVCVHLGLL